VNIPTILIVDDERDQLDNIKNYLELRIKGNFPSAINGEDAIEYIKNNLCDMMILDIRMPKKSGIEVLDIAKDMPMYKIVFTGWDSDQVFEACQSRGIDEYITKGSSLVELYDKVTKELKKRNQFFPLV
jgi:response regulator RpfG family c-di-GMP phosphodiesterase